jgi:hypothetical protein
VFVRLMPLLLLLRVNQGSLLRDDHLCMRKNLVVIFNGFTNVRTC